MHWLCTAVKAFTRGSHLVLSAGNDSGGECGVATARRFIMPGAYLDTAQQESANHGSQVNSPFWYSFDYGSVHFVMLSTEHDVTPGSHQYKVSFAAFLLLHSSWST